MEEEKKEPEVIQEVKQEQVENTNNGLNVAALILGIIAIVLAFIPIIRYVSYILAPIGLILGIVALTKKQKKEMAIAAIALATVAILVVGFAQYKFSRNVKEFGKTLEDAFGDKTEEILAKEVDVTLGDFVVTESEWGFTSTELKVTFKNKSNQQRSFSVQIEAVDASGNRIDTSSAYVSSLAPGQTSEEKAFTWIDDDKLPAMETATFRILTVSSY